MLRAAKKKHLKTQYSISYKYTKSSTTRYSVFLDFQWPIVVWFSWSYFFIEKPYICYCNDALVLKVAGELLEPHSYGEDVWETKRN